MACQNKRENIAKILIKNGADVNLRNNQEISPLVVARYYKYESIEQLLHENGADVNLYEKNVSSPFFFCLWKHDTIVKFFIKNSAGVK